MDKYFKDMKVTTRLGMIIKLTKNPYVKVDGGKRNMLISHNL